MPNGVHSGVYRPNIHEIFGFRDLPAAHGVTERNEASGKLVVTIP